MSLAAALLAAGSINTATITVGDTFHLVFITSPVDTMNSEWNLTQLNAHVNDIANNTGGYSGSVVASQGLTFASLLVLELYIDEVSDPCVYGIVT